jgi:hypothetical protein
MVLFSLLFVGDISNKIIHLMTACSDQKIFDSPRSLDVLTAYKNVPEAVFS